MSSWQLQDAKSRFSEFLNAALEQGPQIVTRRGIEEAVLVPIDEWRRLNQSARPSIKELLLAPPHFDLPIPKRRRWKRRPPIDFTHPDYK
jgi:prevent-host-death family protein